MTNGLQPSADLKTWLVVFCCLCCFVFSCKNESEPDKLITPHCVLVNKWIVKNFPIDTGEKSVDLIPFGQKTGNDCDVVEFCDSGKLKYFEYQRILLPRCGNGIVRLNDSSSWGFNSKGELIFREDGTISMEGSFTNILRYDVDSANREHLVLKLKNVDCKVWKRGH